MDNNESPVDEQKQAINEIIQQLMALKEQAQVNERNILKIMTLITIQNCKDEEEPSTSTEQTQ